MEYTDITQTGYNNWENLQNLINSLFTSNVEYDPYYTQYMQSDVGELHGNPSELVDIGVSINDRIPWGESRYDRNPQSLADYTERNNRRARNLPTILKWASGAGKYFTTMWSTFLSGTLGTVAGLVEGTGAAIAAPKGEKMTDFWHSFSNNVVNKTMTDFSSSMEDVFVNYYTDYEKTAPWWKNLGTANFWADGILKNAGFTSGAVAAALVWGEILPFVGGATAAKGVYSTAKGILGGFTKMALGSIGEANMESIHATNDLFLTYANTVNQAKQFEYQKAKHQYSLDLLHMSQSDASAKYKTEINRINNEALQLLQDPNVEKSIKEAGNAIFGLEFALLSLTNTFEVSNLLKGGKTWARQIASNAVKPILKETGEELTGAAIGKAMKKGTMEYTADLLQKPWLNFAGRSLLTGVSEGFVEEGGQGWISSAEKLYAMSKWRNTPVMAYAATDFFPEVIDRASAYNKAFQQQYGDIDGQGWQEIAMGFIGGIIGAPFFGKKQNADGTSTWGFQWIGGLKNAYDETVGLNNETKQFLQQINTLINDPKFILTFYAAAGLMQSDAEALAAIRRGDVATYKQEEFNAIAQQVDLFTSLGRIDDLIDIYKGFKDSFSEEDIPILQEATGLDLSAYTKDEIIEEFKGKADTTLLKIEAYRTAIKNANSLMLTTAFQEIFAEYLNDPTTTNIIKSHLAFTEANIVELNRRKQNVESSLNEAMLKNPHSVEVAQLQKDLKDINKLLEKAQGIDYAKKHLKETKQEFDQLFNHFNKISIGKDIAKATTSLSQATTLLEVVENFKYLKPDIKDAVVNGVKSAASPELKELIEKYENFDRIQNIIKSKLKDLTNEYAYLGKDNVSALLLILELEFGKAVAQTLMSETGDLSATSLKDILDEILNNDYLDNSDVNDITKTYVSLLKLKLKDVVDTAYSIPTPTPVATGTSTSTISTGCKYENIEIVTDPDVLLMLEETAFQDLLALNKHELYDRYFNTIFVTDEDKVLFNKGLEACKTYFEKHPDATIKDATIALLRDVFTKADIADFQKAAFIAQVVFNKVEAHPIAAIPTPSASKTEPESTATTPEVESVPTTPPIQAPQTTTTNPQTSTSQEPKPQQPVQPTSPKQPVFMFGEAQAYYEWAAQGIEKHNDWGLPKWLMEHGYNLDLMRTKYLRHITPETPIHFIYHKDVANITGLSKVALTPIFLAIDVESLPDGVFNEPTSNKMIVESNGKRYILIGTYGGFKTASAGQEQIKSAQDAYWRNMLNSLLREANKSSDKIIVSSHTTTILSKDGITYGNVVIAERDKNGVDHYHKSEVIQMLGNHELNPLGFTKDNLPFYVNYGVSKHISDGISIDDIIGGNDLTEGQVYMLLPATTLGKYIPFKLNTVTLKEKETEVEANSKFKNRLLNALSGLVDAELAHSQDEELINKTLNAAKQEVFKYLNFKEIAYLGYSKPTPGKTIKINLYGESGGAITTLLDLGTVTPENKLEKIQELYNAILALDVLHSPLINIEGVWISDPNENAMYFGEDTINGTDSLLTTDTNMLAVLHSNFFVHAVDENGNMITQGFSKSTTSKPLQEEKLDMKVYNIAGDNYRYFPSTKTITTESGELLPADSPQYLVLNAILNNTPFTISVGNTTQTYIPFGTVLLRYANKAYTYVTNEKEISKILTQKNQQVLAKNVEEKATKILEKIATAEEQLEVVVGEMLVDKTEEPVTHTKPVTTTKHLNVNVEAVMALTGFTEEEVIQRITANDRAQHQGLYIMANDELAIHLTQRIAALAKLNRLLRRGFPKGIVTQVPLVEDALKNLIDFCKNPINKDLLSTLGLQDTKPIDILRMLVAKHPLRDYNLYYDNDKLINDLNELVNCK